MAKPTQAQETAVTELFAAMGQLVRRLRSEARSAGLSLSQVAIMARLEAGPMTTADLARAESMKPQSMGAALAQMEEEGLVKRQPHPSDGRQILFALTAAGAGARRQTRMAKRDWLISAIATLDRQEQKTLFTAADILKHLAES